MINCRTHKCFVDSERPISERYYSGINILDAQLGAYAMKMCALHEINDRRFNERVEFCCYVIGDDVKILVEEAYETELDDVFIKITKRRKIQRDIN